VEKKLLEIGGKEDLHKLLQFSLASKAIGVNQLQQENVSKVLKMAENNPAANAFSTIAAVVSGAGLVLVLCVAAFVRWCTDHHHSSFTGVLLPLHAEGAGGWRCWRCWRLCLAWPGAPQCHPG
jgi:hypothetical protein